MDNKVNFTSNVRVNWNSIKKYMPEQVDSIKTAIKDLRHNGDNNLIRLRAGTFQRTPDSDVFIKMTIIKNGKKHSLNCFDSRKFCAIASYTDDSPYKIHKPDEKSLDEVLADIKKEKPDFGKIIRNSYEFHSKYTL
jgi:hypothetical protein